MGAEELVGRAGQQVAVPGHNIQQSVRGQVDRIDEDQRPDPVGSLCDLGHGIDRAREVRRGPDGNQAGGVGDLGVEAVEIEGGGVGVDGCVVDDHYRHRLPPAPRG